MDEPLNLTASQAGKILGCSASTVRRWAAKGEIPYFTTPGGHRRFARRDVMALRNRLTPTTASDPNEMYLR